MSEQPQPARRYRIDVQATRAYLAGFGTAGSLLGGAALLFVLASAVVSFRGWPAVGAAPAPVALSVSQPIGAPRPASARLLLGAARIPTGSARTTSSAGRRRLWPPSRGIARSRPGTTGSGSGSGSSVRVVAPGGAPAPGSSAPAPSCAGGCGASSAVAPAAGSVQQTAQQVAGALPSPVTSTVSGAGQAVGSLLGGGN